jgi:hypothetical protein
MIVNFYRLGSIKKQINRFGEEILKIPETRKIKKGLYIYYILMILLVVLLAVSSKEPLIFINVLFFIPAFLDIIVRKQYSKYNGFYANGIVMEKFFEWEKIFSWKKIDEDKLSFLNKNGSRFDSSTNHNQQLIIDFLTEKGIKEEK